MSSLFSWDSAGVEAWREVAPTDQRILTYFLRGFLDAGKTGSSVATHVGSFSDPITVATFDVDSLLDYRSRRPEMVFSVNEWTSYEEPSLKLKLVRDAREVPFLLLHGQEPDLRWEAFCASLKEIVEALEVTLTIGAYGIPMAAPHTREIRASVHGTNQDALPDRPSFFGTVTVPGSAQNMVEYRFGQWGLEAANVAVHVPHYLAQTNFPQSAQAALRDIEAISGLEFNVDELDEEANEALTEIERQVGEAEEVQALVSALETQYDAQAEAEADSINSAGELPTAEELGAEFERFLAEQRRDFPPSV